MASLMFLGRVRGVRSIFSCKETFLAPVRIAASGRRCMSQEKPISRFPVPIRDTLPQDIQQRMSEVEEKGGFLPNVFKVLAHRPDEFRAFFMYYDALMLKEGNLTKAEKEMIVVATSAANNCTYCVIAHGALLRIYAKNTLLGDQVAANWHYADLTEREKAIIEFAMQVSRSETVKDEHIKALETHGLDSEDAWDIGAIAGLFALSNRMAHLTNMRPNDEFYLLGRIKKDKKE
ncbi:unnamed protein product [Porites lobata]|uniref:Carboxymuconolactone decarboxylase-like domain-containing protein n=1 Tax=Porites lobata TaxID=104759 RepID=A0ABN8NTQ6_9CNID|nr:unnamed protein product [Porites lobata]